MLQQVLQTGAVSLVEEESSKRAKTPCFCNHQQKRCKWTTVIMTPDHVEVEILKVLEQMEMTSAFTDVLHVANLTTGSHLMSILTQSDAFSKVGGAQIQKSENIFSSLYHFCQPLYSILEMSHMILV